MVIKPLRRAFKLVLLASFHRVCVAEAVHEEALLNCEVALLSPAIRTTEAEPENMSMPLPKSNGRQTTERESSLRLHSVQKVAKNHEPAFLNGMEGTFSQFHRHCYRKEL